MEEIATIDGLIKKAKTYQTLHEDRLRKAYEFAQRAHAGQTRMSGEAYISHPLGVAMLLTKYKADEESLVVALLHDVIEDSYHTVKELEESFGHTVATMVESLTKLPRVHNMAGHPLTEKFDSKIESIRRIFEIMEEDIRIIIIKLCDRLHNLSSLSTFRKEKQMRIAQETLDIYVRIAERLSLGELKEKLEEMSYQYLYPDWTAKLKSFQNRQSTAFHRIKARLEEQIKSSKYLKKGEILYRQVIPYEELVQRGAQDCELSIEVEAVFDTEEGCYLALSEIHNIWKGIRGRLKDFITVPKSNGFQALETSIIKQDGTLLKFIIQTRAMAGYSRYGVTLQCFEKGEKLELPWLENLKKIHQQTKKMSDEYLTSLESDILQSSIMVSVENNKTLFLPPKSTALDSAFFTLGADAFRVKEILINGKKVHFSQPVFESDILQFQLSDDDQFQDDWIYQISTGYARSFLYERLRSFSTPKKVHISQKLLQLELDAHYQGYLEEISSRRKTEVAKSLHMKSWEQVLESVADGYLNPELVVKKLHRDSFETSGLFTVEIYRESTDFKSLSELVDLMNFYGMQYSHQSSRAYRNGFLDNFLMAGKSHDIHSFLNKISPLYRSVQFRPWTSTSFSKKTLTFLILILCWLAQPFLLKVILNTGFSPLSLSSLELISSGIFLGLYGVVKSTVQNKSLQPLRFNMLFWGVTLFLVLNYLFSNYSISIILPTQFVTIMGSGLVFQYYSSSEHRKDLSLSNLIPLFLTLLSLIFLAWKSYQTPIWMGFLSALAALAAFSIHSSLNARLQEKQKIKDRTLLQLSSMMMLGGALLIPFLSLGELMATALPLYLLIVLTSVLNGLGNILYLSFVHQKNVFVANATLMVILPLVGVTQFLLGWGFLPGVITALIPTCGAVLWLAYKDHQRLHEVNGSRLRLNTLL